MRIRVNYHQATPAGFKLGRRSWLLILLLPLVTSCGWNQNHPSLQVMALAARQETPLVNIDRLTVEKCKYQPYYNLSGSDKTGRTMTVVMDDQIRGYVYTDQLPWEAALARVEAAGYEPARQEPTLAPPKRQGWLVHVILPVLRTRLALVEIPSGDVHLLGPEGLSPCDW